VSIITEIMSTELSADPSSFNHISDVLITVHDKQYQCDVLYGYNRV
jgi:hypothetical protein